MSMPAGSLQLLRGLTSGARPGLGLASGAGLTRSGLQSASFSDLLAKAHAGAVRSEREVRINSESGLEISEGLLGVLSIAADRAEAEGVRNALVLSDEGPMLLDVQTRTVIARPDLSSGVIAGIDGVVDLRTPQAPTATIPPRPIESAPTTAGKPGTSPGLPASTLLGLLSRSMKN